MMEIKEVVEEEGDKGKEEKVKESDFRRIKKTESIDIEWHSQSKALKE